MKYKFVLLLAVIVAGILDCHAKREPSWMKELPLPSNNTYIFVRESGEGRTVTEALNMALVRVFQNTANRLGKTVDALEISEALRKGTNYVTISQQYEIPINKVDQYEVSLKNGSYWVCVLCQVAAMRNVTPIWDKGERAKNDDDMVSMAKSLLPGLGQMGKGHYGEGVATLVGEVALVAGGVGCYYMAQNQLGIMNNLWNDNTRRMEYLEASRKYNNLKNTSYAVWGIAGAVYVINLIRAYTMEPKPDKSFAMSPYLISTPNTVTPALGLTYRF